jgi:urease accessory protein
VNACAELTASAPVDVGGDGAGCRISWVRDVPPFAFRSTPDGIYLVGTAASPVGTDQLAMRVKVEAGATLKIRSAASTIAWASSGSSLTIDVEVGESGQLDWHLQPLVASRQCNFLQYARLRLAEGASARWTEEIVLGRHGEGPGHVDLRLDADVAGHPLVRHQLVIGETVPGWDGPAVMGAHRAVALVLVAGMDAGGWEAGAGAGWATMPLEGPGVLVQAAGPDLLALRRELAVAVRPMAVRPPR